MTSAPYETCVERVWDYPRPPALSPAARRVRVELAGEVLADSTSALRVLETSATVYLPPADVRADLLIPSGVRSTWCEYKGAATYFDAAVGDRHVRAVASTSRAWPGYEELRDHVAFYPGRVDAAWLDDERVHRAGGRLLRRLDHRRPRRPVQGRAGHARPEASLRYLRMDFAVGLVFALGRADFSAVERVNALAARYGVRIVATITETPWYIAECPAGRSDHPGRARPRASTRTRGAKWWPRWSATHPHSPLGLGNEPQRLRFAGTTADYARWATLTVQRSGAARAT